MESRERERAKQNESGVPETALDLSAALQSCFPPSRLTRHARSLPPPREKLERSHPGSVQHHAPGVSSPWSRRRGSARKERSRNSPGRASRTRSGTAQKANTSGSGSLNTLIAIPSHYEREASGERMSGSCRCARAEAEAGDRHDLHLHPLQPLQVCHVSRRSSSPLFAPPPQHHSTNFVSMLLKAAFEGENEYRTETEEFSVETERIFRSAESHLRPSLDTNGTSNPQCITTRVAPLPSTTYVEHE